MNKTSISAHSTAAAYTELKEYLVSKDVKRVPKTFKLESNHKKHDLGQSPYFPQDGYYNHN